MLDGPDVAKQSDRWSSRRRTATDDCYPVVTRGYDRRYDAPITRDMAAEEAFTAAILAAPYLSASLVYTGWQLSCPPVLAPTADSSRLLSTLQWPAALPSSAKMADD